MDLHHIHIENYKGIFHMALFFLVLFKIHIIDRKLNSLEKKFVDK